MLRELTREETGHVSGGDDDGEGGIIVWGPSANSSSLSEQMFSFGAITDPGIPGADVCTLDWTIGEEFETLLVRILNFIFDADVKTDAQFREDEEKLGKDFKPEKVVSTGTIDGQYKTWTTDDGVTWVDTNDNGKPDFAMKNTPDGKAWGNDGTGWGEL